MWSIGCIYAEMALNHPLFNGDSEIDQIFKIFQTLGTPNEESWPGVSQLPDWKPHFPQWEKASLSQVIPKLDVTGIDLLENLLTYSPGTRISAKRALFHEYFNGFDSSLLENPFQD
ncbi:Cyclin-dependent kinase catalytic subunit [Coelomomyces lativittatus]|nr:Cyclin-dependent kinase catalytic subunit [Coelomomyces lativittatus]